MKKLSLILLPVSLFTAFPFFSQSADVFKGEEKYISLKGKEEISAVGENPTEEGIFSDYQEEVTTDLGVYLYQANYDNDKIYVSASSFMIDFTTGYLTYKGNYNDLYYDNYVKFTFKNDNDETVAYFNYESGYIKASKQFYTRYTSSFNLKNEEYFSSSDSSKRRCDLSLFKKPTLSLDEGNYTLTVERNYKYYYVNEDNDGVYYNVTSAMNFALTVDYTPVTLSSKSGYLNEDVTITCSDLNHKALYVKSPEDSDYVRYTASSYTTKGVNGTYLYYGEDKSGNVSDVYSFVLDTIKPTLTYTKTISGYLLSGEDNIALDKIYILYPGNEEYLLYNNEYLNMDGVYSAYCLDKAGNKTELSFTLDQNVNYEVNIINGAYTCQNVIITAKEDLIIKVNKDGEEYVNESDEFAEEGYYEITLTDTSGNCVELTFTIDKTPPTLNLVGVKNGETIEGTVSIDSLSEKARMTVYKDNEEINYTLGEEISEYGEYKIILEDPSGNKSSYSFTLKHVLNTSAIILIVIFSLLLTASLMVFIFIRRRNRLVNNKKPERKKK